MKRWLQVQNMSMSRLFKVVYKRQSHGKKLNTYLINFKLSNFLKIKKNEILNFKDK